MKYDKQTGPKTYDWVADPEGIMNLSEIKGLLDPLPGRRQMAQEIAKPGVPSVSYDEAFRYLQSQEGLFGASYLRDETIELCLEGVVERDERVPVRDVVAIVKRARKIAKQTESVPVRPDLIRTRAQVAVERTSSLVKTVGSYFDSSYTPIDTDF